MTMITQDGWTLTDEAGNPIAIGQEVTDFRGDKATLKGGRSPAGAGKSGYVWTTDGAEFYPQIFKLRWVSPEGRFFGDGK